MLKKLNFGEHKGEVTLYLQDSIAPDKNAVDELMRLAEIEDTVTKCKSTPGFFQSENAGVEKIIVTPDFHKGAGIPIGTVLLTKGFMIPQAMGNDINCGMRVYTTDLTEEQLLAKLPEIKEKVRHIFFQGGRQIPMNGRQREAMFRRGLTGLLETNRDAGRAGIWKYYEEKEQEKALAYTAFAGSQIVDETEGLADFIGDKDALTHDAQIGSIGGGNHFVEVQRIAELYDGQTANGWGLKKGNILFMLHTGSLAIGHHSGLLCRNLCEDIYPRGMEHPDNKIYLIPDGGGAGAIDYRFWSTVGNAANFGFANRLFLGLMLQQAIEETGIPFGMKLLYDSPHNYIWKKEIDGQTHYLHRKGACSAEGMETMAKSPFAYYGEPVMIPGSMGSSSYLLNGMGNAGSLWSASHGAGRKKSRGEAIQGNDKEYEEFMKHFHIITPIDPKQPDLKGRKDILKKWEESIRAEAPYAYKDIDEIVKVHEQHEIAGIVARMEPVFTIKA